MGGQQAQGPATVATGPLPRSRHAKRSGLGPGTQGHRPFPRANVCLPDQLAWPCGLQLKATGLLPGAPGRERMQTGPSLGLTGPEHASVSAAKRPRPIAGPRQEGKCPGPHHPPWAQQSSETCPALTLGLPPRAKCWGSLALARASPHAVHLAPSLPSFRALLRWHVLSAASLTTC